MSSERQKKIFDAWFAIEEAEPGEVSTERLMQMTADQCKCDCGDVAEALYIVGKERGVVQEG